MLNLCPKCHMVSFGKKGWRYINKFNHIRLCSYCGHQISRYSINKAPDWWLRKQSQLHSEWESEQKAIRFDAVRHQTAEGRL